MFRHAVTRALAETSFELINFRDLGQLIAALRRVRFEAVLLEDAEPELLSWLAMLQIHSLGHLPVVVVGPGDAGAISRALLNGAHDYAQMGEGGHALSERLQAQVILRAHARRPAVLSRAGYSLHADTQLLHFGGDVVTLTGREFALAWILFENAGRVVSLNVLSMHVWGKSSDISKRTIEQHVYKLRRKLSDGFSTDGGIHIQTIYGVGYRLCERSCAQDSQAAAASLAWVI